MTESEEAGLAVCRVEVVEKDLTCRRTKQRDPVDAICVPVAAKRQVAGRTKVENDVRGVGQVVVVEKELTGRGTEDTHAVLTITVEISGDGNIARLGKIEGEGRRRPAKRFYLFGVFRIDVTERVLLGKNASIPLTPKAFDTLLVPRRAHTEGSRADFWGDKRLSAVTLKQDCSLVPAVRKCVELKVAKQIDSQSGVT